MKAALRRFSQSNLLPALALSLVMAFAIMRLAGQAPACDAYAAGGDAASDWCYQFSVRVTYSGSTSTFTNYAVRTTGINASNLIATDQMDSSAWDSKVVLANFGNEVDLLAQDLTSSNPPFWIHVPSIGAGQSRTFTYYTGNTEVGRNQGILFTGADSLSQAHHADFNITDTLTVDLELEMLSGSAQDATLVSHWHGNGGWRVFLRNNGGTLQLRAQVDNQTCDVNWNSAWTNTNRQITVTFRNPTLAIAVDGTNQISCNTGLGSISATTTTLTAGNSVSSGILRDLAVSGPGFLSHWAFDPTDMTEATSTNPFMGTIQDTTASNHDFTYTFNRAQTDFTVSVGAITNVNASNLPPAPTAIVSVLGTPFPVDVSAQPSEITTSLFHRIFDPGVDAFEGPRHMAWAIIFNVMAIGAAVAVYASVRAAPLAFFAAALILWYSFLQGYLPWWWPAFWSIFIVITWWAGKQAEDV